MVFSSDYLVIGSGIAGLSFALKVAESACVTIVTKGELNETNTNQAQGGIASVSHPEDSFEQHIKDTMMCGSQKNDPEVVEKIVKHSPSQIEVLKSWGVEFDRDSDGNYAVGREGGHSQSRVLHHKDLTGAEIQSRLIEQIKNHPNIKVFEKHFAVDLLTQHHLGKLVKRSIPGTQCYGAYVMDMSDNTVYTFLSRITILATGGVGNIYHTTTNPAVATGDGVAMAHRAKAKIRDMEFIQFHPTSLYHPYERPSFLISEAVRGYGGILRTRPGEDFMHRYHAMGSLAPRDITARSIDTELKISGEDYLWLDVTHKDAQETRERFPNIYNKCLKSGIDITRDMIPVVPAAHYSCGGVSVDEHGQTSIERLYALGEVASTGLHGANRLASNSLIEAIVCADFAAKHAKDRIKGIEFQENIPQWDFKGTTHPEEMVLITQSYKEMQQIMSYYVGIVRSNIRLERALHRLSTIYEETEHLYRRSTLSRALCELRNMIAVAYLIIKQAQRQQQSVGLHFSLDYPQ